MSLLYHVCNQHEWIDGKCGHEPVTDEDHGLPWFDRRDKDLQALQEVVLAPRLLASLKYYTKFRHTGVLETVNSHSLMYASKRCAFGPTASCTNRAAIVKRRVPVTTNYVNYTAGGNEFTLISPPLIGNN